MISYDEAINRTNGAVRDMLKNSPKDISGMTSQLAQAMGKGIRAKLLLMCAMDQDGLVSEDAVKLAASVEILHLATLVHDDIIDDSPLRRGIPTTQSMFGKKQAVICGDYLLCLAIGGVSGLYRNYGEEEAELLPKFISSVQKICIGEHRQSTNLGNLDLELSEYIRIITGKTAMLFYMSAYAGAIVANKGHVKENMEKISSLAQFGRCLGIMFQIADDWKDYEETEESTRKPIKRDIAEGVVTLPLILAMGRNPALKEMAETVLMKGSDAVSLVHEVCKAGGTADAKRMAARYKKKAERFLLKAFVDEEKKKLLFELIDGVIK